MIYILLATKSGDAYLMKWINRGHGPWDSIADVISIIEHRCALVPSTNPTLEQVIEAVAKASEDLAPNTMTLKHRMDLAEGTRQALRKKYIEVTEGRAVR